jgi:phosphatidylserine/phosphatidylglycerophosphate/cardiolipin synthase-like enzyme
VGIVSSVFSKDSGLNLGCYLSQETQNQLMQWVNVDYEQTELEIRDLSQDELEFVLASPNTQAEDWVGETNPEPEEVEDLYSQFHEHEPDQGEELAELKETGDLESDEELDDLDEQEDDLISHPAETDYPLEQEFQLNRLPQSVQDLFGQGRDSWRAAVAEAIGAGFRDHYDLADLVFFMHHPERMAAGVGKPIDRKDRDFVKLRNEWNKYRGLVIDILRSLTTASCGFFLPANPSKDYEDYVAAPTTGRIKLMINGRDSGGKGMHFDQKEAFDNMQSEVEALGRSDSIYLSAWMFDPTVPLTTTSATGAKTWGELMQFKASKGVKIRILMSDFSPVASYLRDRVYQTFLPALDKLIGQLSASTRDNLKYIVSRHPATQFRIHVATHHQKFMILKKGAATTAFCGGLDIAYMRTPAYWTAPNYLWYWHDIHAKMDGLIARDLEKEFILRWNREKGALSVARSPHTGADAFEDLAQPPADAADRVADINTQRLQMIRTVSIQGIGRAIQNTKRDDIWQAYLRLISCASQFIFMENQYFREPRMADAIVRQAKVHPELIVIIVVPEQLDDPEDAIKSHGNWLQNKFFKRLVAGIASKRLRIYTMFHRIIHSKFILVDDRALSVGSANANPRGFFLDTELNVILDDSETVKDFRHKLWAHELGIPENTVAGWDVSNFIAKWDAVAKANKGLKKAPDNMTGEGVIPFDPKSVKGVEQMIINDVLTET